MKADGTLNINILLILILTVKKIRFNRFQKLIILHDHVITIRFEKNNFFLIFCKFNQI